MERGNTKQTQSKYNANKKANGSRQTTANKQTTNHIHGDPAQQPVARPMCMCVYEYVSMHKPTRARQKVKQKQAKE